jgi:hypothetical protein
MRLNTVFDEYGHVYIRQILRDVMKFENQYIELEVEYELLDNNIIYDIYIQSRFNQDNTTRIPSTNFNTRDVFPTNKGIIKKIYKISDYGEMKPSDKTEGLSVAFRLIGEKGISNSILIKKMTLKIVPSI